MNSTERDIATEKIKLIFEFNDNSPLFARVAASEIELGNVNDAVKILENGITIYPSYPTAYFILAIANAYAGQEDQAKGYAEVGNERLGSPETLAFYEKKILEIISERNSLSETIRPAFIPDDKEEELDENVYERIEDKLDILAEQLSKAKIIPKEIDDPAIEITSPAISIKKIVSDTMAEIFLSQKNYTEALSIYAELLRQKPERAGIYLQKISDLNRLME
ncbi:MAG: tetratricopeptide repeat protein [Melioribacteraceae bacterium]